MLPPFIHTYYFRLTWIKITFPEMCNPKLLFMLPLQGGT